MSIKNIKKYAELRALGDMTFDERKKLLEVHKIVIEEKIVSLTSHLDKILKKIDYYEDKVKSKEQK